MMKDTPNSARRHAWEDVIDDEIRAISRNYASRMGLGRRPALLCIDNYNAVFGVDDAPLLQAMQRYPQTCGPAAWRAVEPTRALMAAARAAGLPVFHTRRDPRMDAVRSPLAATKRISTGDPDWDYTFFGPLAPQDGEYVVAKARASAFHGTPLASYLTQLCADTVIVCGNSTSGCVRASVNEAYMHGLKVAVVEDCVFDRNHLSHKVNLFDMNAKYADVMFLDEVLDYIAELQR
ncbi:isochorismatase family protein [Bordetella petrii]|nr:isochorismatase family protein [Bordetella petrii]